MTIDTFIQDEKITMGGIMHVGENPNMDDKSWQANHYIMVIKKGNKQFATYYSQGLGITDEPKLRDVLDCLANDAQTDGTFEDFCDTFGYSTDSRHAERVYKAVISNSRKLKKLLGKDAYNKLVHEVERL